jgi:hypothetical protein
VKALLPLLRILASTWDQAKYESGIDSSGAARPIQHKVQQRSEEKLDIHAFKPQDLTAALRSPLFHAYVHMICLIEEIPENLALSCELCICHRPLCEGLSHYHKAKLCEIHFGSGISSCPMAGKLAPELVAGSLTKTFEDVWHLQEQALLLADTHGRSDLSAQDRQALGKRTFSKPRSAPCHVCQN